MKNIGCSRDRSVPTIFDDDDDDDKKILKTTRKKLKY